VFGVFEGQYIHSLLKIGLPGVIPA